MTAERGFERFLVGMDDVGLADDAAHAAARMARELDAEIELLHAVAVPPPLWFGIDRDKLAQMHAEVLGKQEKALRKRLAEKEREFELAEDELAGRLRVFPGHAARRLVERAGELGADLIFLGTHERRGVFDFGDTARFVIHMSPCGIWVQPSPWKPVKRILAPIDLSDFSFATLEVARRLARRLRAGLTVLYCFTPPEMVYGQHVTAAVGWPTYEIDHMRAKAREEFDSSLAAFDFGGISHQTLFAEGRPEDEIVSRQRDCDLIVMGTHGRSGLAGFLMGSVAYHVLRRSDTPVLALRNPELTEGGRGG